MVFACYYLEILGLKWLELCSQGLEIRSFTLEVVCEFMLDLRIFSDGGNISVLDLNLDLLTGSLSDVDSGALILFRTPIIKTLFIIDN